MSHTFNEKRYLTFRHYLKEKYGCSVRKVSIHANFTCPNRDGTLGSSGCIYCNNQAFHSQPLSNISIRNQIKNQITAFIQRKKAQKFIAYFQTYTNTYASIKQLKAVYDTIRDFPDIVGLSIGTRPDCVNPEILDLIESYAEDFDVWIEYGLQSAQDKSLEFIRRGHNYSDFLQAIGWTESRIIKICVHVILGLPFETHQDIQDTANKLAKLPIHAVKLHPLQIIRETPLALLYANHKISLLDLSTYVRWIVDSIEMLPPHIVIQRLTADALDDWLIAPDWCKDKMHVLREIDREFERRDSYQGKMYSANHRG